MYPSNMWIVRPKLGFKLKPVMCSGNKSKVLGGKHVVCQWFASRQPKHSLSCQCFVSECFYFKQSRRTKSSSQEQTLMQPRDSVKGYFDSELRNILFGRCKLQFRYSCIHNIMLIHKGLSWSRIPKYTQLFDGGSVWIIIVPDSNCLGCPPF